MTRGQELTLPLYSPNSGFDDGLG